MNLLRTKHLFTSSRKPGSQVLELSRLFFFIQFIWGALVEDIWCPCPTWTLGPSWTGASSLDLEGYLNVPHSSPSWECSPLLLLCISIRLYTLLILFFKFLDPVHVKSCVLMGAHSCLTLCNPMTQPTRLFCLWFGKKTELLPFPPVGDLPNWGIGMCLLCLLHWQEALLKLPGSPLGWYQATKDTMLSHLLSSLGCWARHICDFYSSPSLPRIQILGNFSLSVGMRGLSKAVACLLFLHLLFPFLPSLGRSWSVS